MTSLLQTQPTRHPVYYFYDELVTLKVGIIQKSTLTSQSEFFKDLFSPEVSAIIKDNREGSSDSTPIVCEQVNKADFDLLLSLLITASGNRSVMLGWRSDQCISVLGLADRWQMTKIKSTALNCLKLKANPEVKITLGRQFEDESLIRSGVKDLCLRTTPLTLAEAAVTGLEIAIKCADIREKIWAKYYIMQRERQHLELLPPKLGYEAAARLYGVAYVDTAFPLCNSKVEE